MTITTVHFILLDTLYSSWTCENHGLNSEKNNWINIVLNNSSCTSIKNCHSASIGNANPRQLFGHGHRIERNHVLPAVHYKTVWVNFYALVIGSQQKGIVLSWGNNDCSDGMTPTSSISQNERIFDGAMVLGNIQRKQESPWTWKIANWLVGRVGLVGLHGVGWW